MAIFRPGISAALSALWLAAACATPAVSAPSGLAQQLNDRLQPSSALDRPGFALQVRKGGLPIYEAYSDAADIEQGRAITADTVFHIASLSKQITAAALAHAVQDGLVSMDDPVSQWIPEAAKYGDDLTIAHLVYMTSGLTDYTSVPRPGGTPWATFHYFEVDDAIRASLSVDALQFAPGAQWQYSNVNYMLLARIVAKAYGKPFSDVVAERVFAPLGMSASLINDDITRLIPNRANGYVERTPEVITELEAGAVITVRPGTGLVLVRRNAPHYGGSGVMTRMRDWALWQDEVASHRVFGEAFWNLMLQTRKFDHDKQNDALGLVHGEIEGRATVWYEGGDTDVSSYAVTFPATGISVSCFSNNPLASCHDKALQAVRILMASGDL